MSKKLGRPLEAFDIYLEDIAEGASSAELDEKVTAMFKDEQNSKQNSRCVARAWVHR